MNFQFSVSYLRSTCGNAVLQVIAVILVFVIATQHSFATYCNSRDDSANVTPPDCDAAMINRILADPEDDNEDAVYLNCNLTLPRNSKVLKRLILEGPSANGVTVDCRSSELNGGDGTPNYRRDMIEIRSCRTGDTPGAESWKRPRNIVVRNCNIIGSMRVHGMDKNGEGAFVRESSHKPGHTLRVRAAAPTNVLLDNLRLQAVGRTPVYLGPGVSRVTLQNSEVTGKAESVGVYLDTESTRNTLRDNNFHVTSRRWKWYYGWVVQKREEIAIDGSTHNRIIGNRFSTLEGGGVFLYRNCGYRGTVRYSAPQYNEIINNVFYYRNYTGLNPAVYFGSKGDDWYRTTCNDDDGYEHLGGSSADNRSFARHNIVIQNQFYNRKVFVGNNSVVDALVLPHMVRQGDSSNKPNTVEQNELVDTHVQRPAKCYFGTGYKSIFDHNESTSVVLDEFGFPRCTSSSYRCSNGIMRSQIVALPGCRIDRVSFGCQISGDSNGCSTLRSCPNGGRVVGARAACNLEYGSVSSTDLSQVSPRFVKVIRESDNRSRSGCRVEGTTIKSGADVIRDIFDRTYIRAGCKEHDKNGGDCHVLGDVYCARFELPPIANPGGSSQPGIGR